jgi:hypothetical protein
MKAVTPGIMTRPITPAFALMQQGLTGLRCGALFPAAWPPERLQGSETQTASQPETFFSKTTCQQQEFVVAHFEQETAS